VNQTLAGAKRKKGVMSVILAIVGCKWGKDRRRLRLVGIVELSKTASKWSEGKKKEKKKTDVRLKGLNLW